MCNLGEGIYENGYNQAVADEQARQAIETEKLLKKMENEKEVEFRAKMENKAKELIKAGIDEELVKKIMSM